MRKLTMIGTVLIGFGVGSLAGSAIRCQQNKKAICHVAYSMAANVRDSAEVARTGCP